MLIILTIYLSTNAWTAGKPSQWETHHNKKSIMSRTLTSKIAKDFPGYFIHHQCEGSFLNEPHNEFAISIYHQKNSNYKILIVTEDFKKSHVIYKKKTNFSTPSDYPDIQCLSSMAVKRMQRTIKKSEIFIGKITPKSSLDTLCFEDIGEGEHICYNFNPKQKKLTSVGGWSPH